MLAALLATRSVSPPRGFRYTNRLVAETTTFTCITVTKKAAFITTSLPIRQQLSVSMPGQESILDQLNRQFYQMINQYALDSTDYLSALIAQVIAIDVVLTPILQTMPVAPQNVPFLIRLQRELARALAVLQSLAVPI